MVHPLIVFEGPDRVGKTTLASRLSSALEAKYYYSVPENLTKTRQEIEQILAPLQRVYFYILCNSIRSSQYRKEVETNTIIADRYFFTTIAYFSILFNIETNELYNRFYDTMNMTLPDAVVLLTSESLLLEGRRNEQLDIYDQISHGRELHIRYKNILSKFDFPVIEIDTSFDTIEESLCKIMKELQSLKIIN